MKDGFKLVKKASISVDALNFQCIKPVFCPDLWESHTAEGSPHARFLRDYMQHGKDWNILLKTDYIEQYRRWNDMGFRRFNGEERGKPYFKLKILNFISLFQSIKKNGYDSASVLSVLRPPFWATRYNASMPFSGYEIWHGHHRAACCYVLGIKSVPCNIMKDKKPGSCKSRFDQRLKGLK